MATFSSDEIKILGFAAPIMLKMLNDKEKFILNRMRGAYKNGKKDFIPDIAEYVVVRDQIEELERTLKLAHGEKTEGE